MMAWVLGQTIDTTQKLAIPPSVDVSEISRAWGEGGSVSVKWLFIAGGLGMLVVAAASLRNWRASREARSSPLGVFNRVAASCALSWGDRLLLWRIARQQGLPSPLTLLVSPATLRHHARAYADERGAAGRLGLMRRVHRMRGEIFEE